MISLYCSVLYRYTVLFYIVIRFRSVPLYYSVLYHYLVLFHITLQFYPISQYCSVPYCNMVRVQLNVEENTRRQVLIEERLSRKVTSADKQRSIPS